MYAILVTMIEQNNIEQHLAADECYMLLRRKGRKWREAAFF